MIGVYTAGARRISCVWFTMISLSLPLLLLASPVQASESFAGHQFYAGDLHAHTGASKDAGSADMGECSESCGALADAVEHARTVWGLDFLAFTDHTNGAKMADEVDYHAVLAETLARHDPENGFLMIPGAELWFGYGDRYDPTLGHKNLYFFSDDDGLLSHLTVEDNQFAGSSTTVANCEEIWNWADELRAVWGDIALIPHHPAAAKPMPTDWSCQEVMYAPAVEIYSEHGSSELLSTAYDPVWSGVEPTGTVQYALDTHNYGHRLGFVGGTDSHDTRPGGICSTDTEKPTHPFAGGLTIAVLPDGTQWNRSTLYEALIARRTYATSGPVIPVVLAYSSGGAPLGELGDVLALPPGQDLDVTVQLPAEKEPFVQKVTLDSTGLTWPLTPAGHGVWSTRLSSDTVPDYFYITVHVDGGLWWSDQGCPDGGVDDNERIWMSPSFVEAGHPDKDGDGFAVADGDCDDGDATRHPAAREDCQTEGDQDCDGLLAREDPDCTEHTTEVEGGRGLKPTEETVGPLGQIDLPPPVSPQESDTPDGQQERVGLCQVSAGLGGSWLIPWMFLLWGRRRT